MQWDCVASVYFVDTAHDVLEYVERVAELLRPGGLWVNLGPLLWHFADSPDEPSLEISWERLRELVLRAGFEILVRQPSALLCFCNNMHILYQFYEYFFTGTCDLSVSLL